MKNEQKNTMIWLVLGLLCVTGLQAETPEFRADGTLIAKGSLGVGSLLSTDQGAGTRMLWYPAKGAFRAGSVDGAQWDLVNIGQDSTAFGYNPMASGLGSTAMGPYTSASGYYSTAIGIQATASGDYSMAIGFGATASGVGSTSIGKAANASGLASTAIGVCVNASGYNSIAMGVNTNAQAYASAAIGTYNVGGGDTFEWVATDPLFEVGNGRGYLDETDQWIQYNSNAFTVYKNGNVTAQGVITAAPGGDIPMFSGN